MTIYRTEYESKARGYIRDYWKRKSSGDMVGAARKRLEYALFCARYWDQFLEGPHNLHPDILEDESRVAWDRVGYARDELADLGGAV